MAVFTAAAPPAQAALGDQWYDTGNGNRRCEASAVVSWGAAGWSGWTGSSASVQVEAQPSGPAVLMVICAGTGNWPTAAPAAAAATAAQAPHRFPAPAVVAVAVAAVPPGPGVPALRA